MYTTVYLCIVFFVVYHGVLYQVDFDTQVLPLCVLAGGLTGILTHQILEERSSDVCDGNECGGQGECVNEFCICETGFCGANCERSDQETGLSCPCPLKSSICVEDTCVCECGFTFNERFNICRKDCAKGFADTFTLFEDFALFSEAFDERSFPEDTPLQNVRTTCNELCLQEPACISYDINRVLLSCSLHGVSKEDVGIIPNNIAETYERDCIDEVS